MCPKIAGTDDKAMTGVRPGQGFMPTGCPRGVDMAG